MNRKQRKIKKMIARRHTGHAAITPNDKLLGRDCLLIENFHGLDYGDNPAKVLAMSREGDSILIYCPYFQQTGFGHGGGGFMDGDIKIKGIEKYLDGEGCYWVSKEELRFK